jgi:hypothetical protein
MPMIQALTPFISRTVYILRNITAIERQNNNEILGLMSKDFMQLPVEQAYPV